MKVYGHDGISAWYPKAPWALPLPNALILEEGMYIQAGEQTLEGAIATAMQLGVCLQGCPPPREGQACRN